MENLSRCAVCGSDSFEDFIQCTDHFVTGEKFTISGCLQCGFHFTNPRPLLKDSGTYYESEKYISHSKTSRGLTNTLFHQARKLTIRSKRKLVRKYSSAGSVLDYGCGTGEFLAEMKNIGFSCTGIEPNSTARESAVASYGLKVLDEGGIENIESGSLGCITLWHVLEHVYPLRQRVDEFYNKLENGGTLIVALPNMLSYDAKKYKEFWAAYDVPRHIHHFTPSTVQQLMKNAGFDHIKTLPMCFDAFYISLLSEKYRHGHEKYINAFFTGLRSNITAFFGKGNYSSLIYIFKKAI
jgi:2-polyprenyl-3-methyl-5-hydroxy-6-metoxy-1,4-benzoquinol methylase